MKRAGIFAPLLVAAFALYAAVLPVQTQSSQVANAPQAQGAKPITGHFEVLHMMRTAIQVRSLTNEKEVHTFTYSDQIRDQMQNLFDQGGYQYGDKVNIQYLPGTEIALKIKGKPSKSL
jgi:hypothetical protein